MHHPDDVGQAGPANVLRRFLRALRVVFDGHDPPAGLASAEAEPDPAVTARGADLENRPRAAGRHEYAEEPAVFLGDRELAGVGGLDAPEDRVDLRSNAARRSHRNAPGNRRSWRLRRNGDADRRDEHERHARTHTAIVLFRLHDDVWRTNSAARAAVSRPSAMQSGIPIARKPLPARKSPGIAATRRSIVATRARCPTSYCGLWRGQRNRRLNSGLARDRHRVGELVARRGDELLVRPFEPMGIAASTEETAQQHVAVGGAPRPLRRDPGGGQQRAVLDARHDEAAATHGMRNLIAREAERHRRGGRVRDAVAQARQRRVEPAQQVRRDVGRHAQNH